MNGGAIAAMMGMMAMNKENLMRAAQCVMMPSGCVEKNGNTCKGCMNYQMEYDNILQIVKDLYRYVAKLEKSNRNWRRKCQRLRAKIVDEDLAQ